MRRLTCFHLCLAFVLVSTLLLGCGGSRIKPIGVRIQDADRKFDTAEALYVKFDKDTEPEKWHAQVAKKKVHHYESLLAYLSIIQAAPASKFAQRAYCQIAEIYKRHYEWDNVIESYEAILAIAPSGYYADKAKSGIADIHKYRRLIEEKRHRYHIYRALYAQDNTTTNHNIAAQALYDVAHGYEQLGDYPQAIANYQRLVDEFPDYHEVRAATTKIGDIHFYKLYDYRGGWRAYHKVMDMGTGSRRTVELLNETNVCLGEIGYYEAEIARYRNGSAVSHSTRKIALNKIALNGESCPSLFAPVFRSYRSAAHCFEKLRNYAGAILAYRELAERFYYESIEVEDARYNIGRLYQLNGQFEQAIDAYQRLLHNNFGSLNREEGIYQQAVCYREIREFAKAYEGFKAYISVPPNLSRYRYQEAEQIVRQFEIDEDGDGFMYYVEQEAGTSDRDPNDHPNIHED